MSSIALSLRPLRLLMTRFFCDLNVDGSSFKTSLYLLMTKDLDCSSSVLMSSAFKKAALLRLYIALFLALILSVLLQVS